MNKKVTGSIIGIVFIIFVLGVWYLQTPHKLTNQQVLQRFSWRMTETDGIKLGTVKFTEKNMKINKQVYDYHYSDDVEEAQRPSGESDDGDQFVGTLIIDDGPYAGHYALEMDSTDYNLYQQGHLKYTLTRKD
ncbi:hypothetical protein PUF88_06065 [Lactobacillaceae bacterium L1_55_11]|nr:hypothetical protein [Lactobacillaceae bacterium L1_55_11]